MAVALVGCGGRPPAEEVSYAGAIRSADVARGGEVFTYICAACHDGRVNPRGYRWSPGQMRRQVREGNRLMPAIREHLVTEDDLEAVLAYLSTIDAVDGSLPRPDPPEARASTPPSIGAQLADPAEEEPEDALPTGPISRSRAPRRERLSRPRDRRRRRSGTRTGVFRESVIGAREEIEARVLSGDRPQRPSSR